MKFLVPILAGLAVLAWWQLMRGRQRATVAAAHVCEQQGVQLLDETVSWRGVVRDGPGGWPGLVFVFEFTGNGARRYPGRVLLGRGTRVAVQLGDAALT